MWPFIILSSAVGLFAFAKGKPKTALNKRTAFGPRTGETWDVEDFPDAKLIVVHSRRGDGSLATFHSEPIPDSNPPRKRFKFNQGKGSPTLIAMMRDDFEGTPTP